MADVIGLGWADRLPTDWRSVAFASAETTHDAEVVVWDLSGGVFDLNGLDVYGAADGRPLVGYAHSLLIKQAIDRRRTELAAFLAAGGDLVMFAENFEYLYLTVSGNKTARASLLDASPVREFTTTLSEGQNVAILDNGPIGQFLRKYEDRIKFKATLGFASDAWKTLAATRRTRLSVAAVRPNVAGEGSGRVVLLPKFDLYFQSEQGYGFDKQAFDVFWADLVEAVRPSAPEKQLPPAWAAGYQSERELRAEADVERAGQALALAEVEVERSRQTLEDAQQAKALLYAQGDELEAACTAVFVALGGEALAVRPGREDLRVRFSEFEVVGEVKGLVGSAAEKNAAQLEKWAMDLALEGVQYRAILLVNAYREQPPRERTDAAFPHQMLKFAQDRGHYLMTTSQFYSAMLELEKDPASAPAVLERIFASPGVVSGFSLPG